MRLIILPFLLVACSSDPPSESQAEAEALNQAAKALDAQTLPPPVLVGNESK